MDGGDWALGRVVYNSSTGATVGSTSILSSSIVFNEINGFTTVNDYTYIVGAVNNGANGYDYLTVVVDPGMDLAWTATWDGTDGKDVAKAVAVDGSGNVYVAGYTTTATHGPDYATVKYNSSGTLQWVETYDGAKHSNDQGTDVEVDENGDVFVTGFAKENGEEDYVTFWYDDSGTELWHGSFNSVYNRKDRAVDLELDEDGNIFVTGRTVKVDAELDATVETTTVKYRKTDLLIPPDEEEISDAISFVKNNGQLVNLEEEEVPEVKFYTHGNPIEIFFKEDEIDYVLAKIDRDTGTVDTIIQVGMTLIGANDKDVRINGTDEIDAYSNHYSCTKKEGRERVPHYSRLTQNEVYDFIDVQYTTNSGGVKYYFIIKPGGNPDDIQMEFDGNSGLSISDGALLVETPLGNIQFEQAEAYQIDGSGDKVTLGWQPSYSISGSDVTFDLDTYDDMLPIVLQISPVGYTPGAVVDNLT